MLAIQEQHATAEAQTYARSMVPASESHNALTTDAVPPLAANVLRRQVLAGRHQQPTTMPMLRTRRPLTISTGGSTETALNDAATLPIASGRAAVELKRADAPDVGLRSIAVPRHTIVPVMRSAIVPAFPSSDPPLQSRSTYGTDQRLLTRVDHVGSRFRLLQREAWEPDDLAQSPSIASIQEGMAASRPRASEQQPLLDSDRTRGVRAYVRRSAGQVDGPSAPLRSSFRTNPAEPAARSAALDLIQPMRSAARQVEASEQRVPDAIQMRMDESSSAEPATEARSGAAAEPDIEALAKKVYDHLRRQLFIDQERRGR
jgi:hypothetical protein